MLIVMVGLYEEPDRPINSTDYIKKYLGAGIDIDALKTENEQMKKRIKELEKTVEDLNKSLKEARGS